MLWFIKLSVVLQWGAALRATLCWAFLQRPAMLTVPDKLIKTRVWDREIPSIGRAGREQLNAVSQALADKEQKPALLLPTIPKLLWSPETWQDAVFLLSPWDFAQLKGSSDFWRTLPGTQCSVWISSWETLNANPLNKEQATQLKHWAMAKKPQPSSHSRPEGHSLTQTKHHWPSRLVYWQENWNMKAREAEGRIPICCQSLRLHPLPFPTDLAGHQHRKKGSKLMCFWMGILGISGNLFPLKTVKHRKKLPNSFAVSVLGGFQTQQSSEIRVWSQSWPLFEHEIELQTSSDSCNLIIPLFKSLWSLQIPTCLPCSPKDMYCSQIPQSF